MLNRLNEMVVTLLSIDKAYNDLKKSTELTRPIIYNSSAVALGCYITRSDLFVDDVIIT